MVDLSHELFLIMLESGRMTYTEYIKSVPDYAIPKEYKTIELFLKNKGKASNRMIKESEWRKEGINKGIIPQ